MRSVFIFLLAWAFAWLPARAQEGTPDLLTVQGELTAGLPKRENGASFRDHQIRITAAAELVVGLTSTDFDTFLLLTSPTGVEYRNDDFEGQSNSQLTVWAMEEGLWTVRASSFAEAVTGAYKIEVGIGPPVETRIVQGRLDPQDEQMPKGEAVDRLTVSLAQGAFLYAELYSLGFDGFLSLEGPDGVFHRNDDAMAGDTTRSRVGPIVLPGDYQVSVTSIRYQTYGAYDLRLIQVPPDYESPTLTQGPQDEGLEAGMRVARGPDWEWGDQDGTGAGTVGISTQAGWWSVTWDSGGRNSYRWGADGFYDLTIVAPVDPSALAVGDQVLLRADVGDFEGTEAVSAFSSHAVEVVSISNDQVTVSLPDGQEAVVDPLWIELIQD